MLPAHRRVLVVEDERVVARDLQLTLAELGYDAYATAASAREALERAREGRPDLVLLDVRIAGDVDGVETAQMLRASYDVPVVFLTAYADDEAMSRALATRPFGYLMKPVRVEELRSAVEIALCEHEAQRRLREREQWFSTTLQAIGDAVIVTDADGTVAYMNAMAEELTGHRLVVGTPLRQVVRLRDERSTHPVPDPVTAALQRPDQEARTGLLMTKSGERVVAYSAAPFDDPPGAVLVLRDVTTERRLQHQIVMTDRLSSLGTLAAGIAHEIKNPLAVVVANASEAAQDLADLRALELDDVDALNARLAQLGELLADVELGADRVGKIVNDLRSFSRPQQERLAAVDVEEAIRWAIRVSAGQLRGRAEVRTSFSGVPAVSASEVRLGQVFLNLIVNASQAMRSYRSKREIRIATALRDEQHVVVTVEDTGCGIAPEVQERIFEPFYTTKAIGEGSGLGLAVTYGIVKSFGGTITVDSQLDHGTTFTVLLPVATDVEQRDAAPAGVQAPNRRGRIMVVDDDPDVLQAITRILQREHEVLAFGNAAEAVEALAEGCEVDLILCDLMMPRMTGKDVYEQLRIRASAVLDKFYILTAGALTSGTEEFLASLPLFLEKPIHPSALREFVRERLARRA